MSYAASFSATNFNADTLFVWMPDISDSHIIAVSTAYAGVGAATLSSYTKVVGWTSPHLKIANDPAPSVILATNERAAALTGSLVIDATFGDNIGILRAKRLTVNDTQGTIADLVTRIRTDQHATSTYNIDRHLGLTFKSGVQDQSAVGKYTPSSNANWSYDSNAALSGWVFMFTTLSTSANVPPPLLRLHSQVRLQHELTDANNHLKDFIAKVPIEVVERCNRHGSGPKVVNAKGDLGILADRGNAVP
jgi:hypothetical protein